MSAPIILATAGHIDHGKTSLVKALTGIDADRLPEEKARGITLDLGFAYRHDEGSRNGTTLGFVDVPGHERLVRTMVAGATGVDGALLVVAADDGVMPQTREHLSILDLLGIGRGVVAITKSDRVDATRLAAVTAEVRSLLAGTTLADAPILPCSSRTGAGLAALSAHLVETVGPAEEGARQRGFRLAVDRHFTVPGVGLVVTGAVHAGTVAVGDRLLLSPGGREVRVRGIRAQDRDAERGGAGERCALNIVGPRLSREDVHRGDWLVAPDLHGPATRLDVRLRLLPSEPGPLRHRTPVQVHLGAAAVAGRVLLLDGTSLEPGAEGLAQLTLDAPLGALGGDRYVLRDVSARRTLGGGRVVDPFGPRRGLRSPNRRALLEALSEPDDARALSQALAGAEGGIDLDHFRHVRNVAPAAEAPLFASADLRVVPGPSGRLGFSGQRLDAVADQLRTRLDALHRDEPDNPGLTYEELLGSLPRMLHPALRPALQAELDAGRVLRRGSVHHRPGHVVRLAPVDVELWEQICAIQRAAGRDQHRLSRLAERLGHEPDEIRPLLDKLGRIGWLRRVSKAYYVLPEAVADLAGVAETVAGEHPEGLLTVGNFRAAAGIDRHITMPLLEHFDAAGFTTRLGEGRRITGNRQTIFTPGEGAAAMGPALP
ncbi:selenocysteine-specific translation elongation factor [Methylorubrum suomiense]|uniref:Selenocysteine-specific elongation factor n=1 Tax=Methylorubrum suomiense TaxID=144191 RepID=A0ABQ4UYC0_9HYPH|nr:MULTISPECIES: selenocysteine-specific translation elongation factor [Methylobacteriaceae]GJE77148.1 Selenocysteine-specific elongation factor [Methylorubrum suomiense]